MLARFLCSTFSLRCQAQALRFVEAGSGSSKPNPAPVGRVCRAFPLFLSVCLFLRGGAKAPARYRYTTDPMHFFEACTAGRRCTRQVLAHVWPSLSNKTSWASLVGKPQNARRTRRGQREKGKKENDKRQRRGNTTAYACAHVHTYICCLRNSRRPCCSSRATEVDGGRRRMKGGGDKQHCGVAVARKANKPLKRKRVGRV